MIVRRWGARGTAEGAEQYEAHFRGSVLPELAGVAGHRGAYLLRRDEGGHVELTVITLWASMDAVRAFAGSSPDRAVVEDRAREVLDQVDDVVSHHDVVVDTVR